MVFSEGIYSLIESLYLQDDITDLIGPCNVFVNPNNTKYLVNKFVIINSCEYPTESIEQLIRNGCKIISRVYFDYPEIEVSPYILTINSSIMWNGKTIYKFKLLDDIVDDQEFSFDKEKFTMYFPKLDLSSTWEKPVDIYGNLSALGWVCQQVGINLKTETPFKDLDIIKTGKVIVE